ncbi:MAG: XRE family transcriptional regulator, partial [Sphingomonadaceae bacterium]
RFGASVEQVAHRLTTLQRVGQRGLPFFMARVDRAGQFSKRFTGASGATLLESQHSCPLMLVHRAFERSDRWLGQAVMLEEGAGGASHWFTLAHAVSSADGAEAGQFVVVLGLEAGLAGDLAQARGISLRPEDATPIGLGCRNCRRLDCRQRSLPPRGVSLSFDRMARANTPFSFS